METETWKPVVGFEGAYEISSRGAARSLDRVVLSEKRSPQRWKGRVLRPGSSSTEYYTVALSVSGSAPKSYTIHELVAAAFIGERPAGHDIDHINGDRRDNRVENLRYVTHEINTRNITKARSKSGYLGVYPNGSGWIAQAKQSGRTFNLGTYRTVEEAVAARAEFEARTCHRGL